MISAADELHGGQGTQEKHRGNAEGVDRQPAHREDRVVARRGGGDQSQSRVERGRAVHYLQANPEILANYMKVCDKIDAAQDVAEADAVRGARWIRLLRLGKSIVLEHRLREAKDRGTIKRFEALRKLESGNPLRS